MKFAVKLGSNGKSLTCFDGEAEMYLASKRVGEILNLAHESQAKSRSIQQNHLAFRWYKIIEDEIGESAGWAYRHCKLTFGIPILCRDREKFAHFWETVTSGKDYQFKMMVCDELPVTRLFDTRQMTEYLDTLQMSFASQGIVLPGGNENENA